MGLNGLSTQERRWPLPAASQAARQQWVSDYEARSARFAACRFIDQLGATTLCSAAQTFVIWHDERSKRTPLWHWPEHLRDHSQSLLLETGV
jgi:type IV secretory pathway TrbF-like protein